MVTIARSGAGVRREIMGLTQVKTILTAAAALAASLFATAAVAADGPGSDDSFWSRLTLGVPVYTHHFPHDDQFNDHNWGAFLDVKLMKNLSFDVGDFKNSYRRNTAFAAVAYTPINIRTEHLKVDLGAMVGADLNGGYRPFNSADPLLGAFIVKVGGRNYPDFGLLNRMGFEAIIIPPPPKGPGATAVNVSVTYRMEYH